MTVPFLFRPPTRLPEGDRLPSMPNPRTQFDDGRAGYPLMRNINRGQGKPVAVLYTGGVFVEKAAPTTQEIAAATLVYMGGHDHIITATEKTLLEAAGYTVITY